MQTVDNPNENCSFRASICKRFKKIKYKGKGIVNISKYLQNIDNKFATNKNNSYTFEIGRAETLFKNFTTVEIGLKKTIGNYTSSNSISKFSASEPFINIDYDFLKGFIFSFDYTYSNYKNETQNSKNSYQIANATLSYKKDDSAWSFKIEAKNIFNTKFKQNNGFSQYLISDTKIYLLPRIFMFSIGYNL